MNERLLTTREVATMLGLSPASVLRRWRAGELPGYRLASNCLRFDANELDAWLESHRGDGSLDVLGRPDCVAQRERPVERAGLD